MLGGFLEALQAQAPGTTCSCRVPFPLPPLRDLVHKYHLPDDIAMLLVRPAMRSDDPLLRSGTFFRWDGVKY